MYIRVPRRAITHTQVCMHNMHTSIVVTSIVVLLEFLKQKFYVYLNSSNFKCPDLIKFSRLFEKFKKPGASYSPADIQAYKMIDIPYVNTSNIFGYNKLKYKLYTRILFIFITH